MCFGFSAMQFSDNIEMRLGFSMVVYPLSMLLDVRLKFFYPTLRYSCILPVMMRAHHETDTVSWYAVMKVTARWVYYQFGSRGGCLVRLLDFDLV